MGRKRPPQPGKKRPPQSKEKWRRRFRVNLRSRPGTCTVPSRPSERTLRVGAPGSHHARGAVGGAVASRWRPRTFGHLKITVIKKVKKNEKKVLGVRHERGCLPNPAVPDSLHARHVRSWQFAPPHARARSMLGLRKLHECSSAVGASKSGLRVGGRRGARGPYRGLQAA